MRQLALQTLLVNLFRQSVSVRIVRLKPSAAQHRANITEGVRTQTWIIPIQALQKQIVKYVQRWNKSRNVCLSKSPAANGLSFGVPIPRSEEPPPIHPANDSSRKMRHGMVDSAHASAHTTHVTVLPKDQPRSPLHIACWGADVDGVRVYGESPHHANVTLLIIANNVV